MEKIKLLFGRVCLVLILLSSFFSYGPAQAASTSVLPPSIMPVVILKGSDCEMGYQYGQQAGQYIEIYKDGEWAKAVRMVGSRDKVLHELKGYQYYIKNYAPEAIKEMKGIADGATAAGYKVSYIDILLINSIFATSLRPSPTAIFPPGAKDDKMPPEGCSAWSAWGSTTTDGRLICGKSSDTAFDYQVAIVAFPDVGNSFLGPTRAGCLTNTPMNNKGVFIGVNGGFALRDIDYDYRIPYPCSSQHLIQFADSATKAKDMLLSWKKFPTANMLFSDINGNHFVVEMTTALQVVRKPRDFGETDFIYATNNHFKDEMRPAIKGEKFIEYAGWIGSGVWSINSIPRNQQMWNMFYNYQGKVNLDFAKMMWRFPGNPPQGSLDAKAYIATKGKGWDAKICNLCSQNVIIALPDNGDKGVMYICTGPASRVAYPLFPGADWYQIAGTHTFYQLALASSPDAVVRAAMDTARSYIAEAYQKLMILKYTDTGYAALNELYSQANAEYYEGVNAYNKGSLTNGNKSLLYFAQAATAFTRSQAHAKQVSNALVPPPTRPEDLGLKPYGGPWAKWATGDH